uniref:Endo-1,4-beta-mannosidase n=1 Tax=feces metagenome TaxID=1861841 RepID=A0A2I2K945_9ZZZZ
MAIKNTDEYIDSHLAIAEKYGKPVVLEEFGFPRDGFKFAQGSPTRSRDRYYRHVFNRIVESAREGGLFAGLNFWGWGGLASQSETNIFWRPGDDYCGDPAQEQQGLNSVYAGDISTLWVIKRAADQIEKALLPSVNFDYEGNDGIFENEGKNNLDFTVNAVKAYEGELELVLSTDFGDTVDTQRARCDLGEGEKEFSFELDLVPGFYSAVVNFIDKDGNCVELGRTNIGCAPEKISSPQDKQPDFDEFWSRTLDELAAVAPEYRMTLLEEHSNDVRRSYRVDMKSLGGEPVSGLLVMPVKEGKYPAMIHYMGYGSDVWYADPSSNPEMIDFTLCVRNQAMNRKPGEDSDWCTRGLEDKETYYYRGAFADAVRAVDFVCSLEKTDLSRVFAEGESQGGALTLAAASLDHRFKAIVASAPFLNDYRDYFSLVGWPGGPIIGYAKENGISDEDMYRTLSYFDIKNFTDKIECPMLMAVGLQDVTCPPHTNFAGYNHIKTDKKWICYPHSGHNVWQQPQWPGAREEYFKGYL